VAGRGRSRPAHRNGWAARTRHSGLRHLPLGPRLARVPDSAPASRAIPHAAATAFPDRRARRHDLRRDYVRHRQPIGRTGHEGRVPLLRIGRPARGASNRGGAPVNPDARGRAKDASPVVAATGVGSGDVQSALSPLGLEAEQVHTLFWVLTAFGGAVVLGVLAITILAALAPDRWRKRIARDSLVIGGGIVFPVVALRLLLGYGLILMRPPVAASESDRPRIAVIGERWWWRVVYTGPEGQRIESANELRIPVGRPVEIALTTADVIHSFWVPRLAGKLDMIPGRVNVQTLHATEPGISRGQCAEYCGGAHALMSFYVVAMEEAEFRAWLAAESSPARAPGGELEETGRRLFLDSGCGACHAVRGTPAVGTIGPDLTHVGSRLSLAAAALPNDAAAFGRWIRDNQHIKPDNLMPPFRIFGEPELAALAAYLEGLK